MVELLLHLFDEVNKLKILAIIRFQRGERQLNMDITVVLALGDVENDTWGLDRGKLEVVHSTWV